MATLPIYLYGSDMLRRQAKPVQELGNETIKLIYDMFETMHKASGIGLAATQVGEMKRVIVIDVTPTEEEKDEEGEDTAPAKAKAAKDTDGPKQLVLINPEVMDSSGEFLMEEGCLSIPDVRSEVKRAESVKIRFRDANFQKTELEAGGLLARVILHEIDHLNGVLFIDHLSSAKRGLLRAKLRKIKKGDVETNYPVVTSVEV